MAGIAVVTDSNSGITQEQAKELGVYVLPMPFMIDGKSYLEDIEMKIDEFFEYMEADADITTSQPDPASIMELWDRLLKEYDQIIHIPMSKGLSSSLGTSMMLSKEEEYDGKVFVVDNQRISVTQRQSVLDAKEMIAAGLSAEQIVERLLEEKFQSSIYIMLNTLKYLKKGGRLTPAAALIGTVLKIKPVLQIQGEKLDAFAKVKTIKKAKQVMIAQIKKDMNERFGGEDKDNVWLEVAYTKDDKMAQEFVEDLKEEFPDFDIHVDPLSLSVTCHIGPGALALACSKKIKL